jgi:hypothetical protein
MEQWGSAHFDEDNARKRAEKARDAYQDGLRGANSGI